MKKFLHADWWKNFEMVEQKERTRITQSGKNCAMNCAIQGVRLIWKQKIWLAICEYLFRDFPVNQFNFNFLRSISTFCTEFQLSALFGINWHALSQRAWWIFACILLRNELTSALATEEVNYVRGEVVRNRFDVEPSLKPFIAAVVN